MKSITITKKGSKKSIKLTKSPSFKIRPAGPDSLSKGVLVKSPSKKKYV